MNGGFLKKQSRGRSLARPLCEGSADDAPELLFGGVLVADKPAGWTSHDVVAKVKRTLDAKKVGHLGTLDPMATGVLPLVINGATKFADSLGGGAVKVYSATLKLGEDTDTYDKEGQVVRRGETGSLTDADVRGVLRGFAGKMMQTPPMYSAIKKHGVPLYTLARKGVEVEREAREIEIHSFEILGISMPFVEFSVKCSKGTYVRSICHDAGAALGCGGHLFDLRRMASGVFTIDEAVSPLSNFETLACSIIPLEGALKRCGGNNGAEGGAGSVKTRLE
ncbi:MAG: tRNA pseudouridine(55) synthase TruB [Deltaproteobacteria bacterium]|nr:tRNA pseudouridine(55) synthase TruB [Deltaproteobacteria bacterium]